jgi:chromosome segregation ATPase
LEKAERASIALHEKQVKAEVLMKKVEGLEKQSEKQKLVADKKLMKENQVLQDELKKLKYLNEQFSTTKDAELEKLISDRSKFKKKAVDLMSELERIKSEYNSSEAKLKEEVKELSKRCQQVTEKLQSQKQDFHSTIQKLNTNYEEQKMEFEVQISSFTGQKKAYLERIGQLESDLEILERSVFQKDEQIERLQRQVLKSRSLNESEFESAKSSLENALLEIESLKATNLKKQLEFEEEFEKMRELLDQAHLEKDQEQQRFEVTIMTLEQTIAQYESEYSLKLKEKDSHLLHKDQEIQKLREELDSSGQNLYQTQEELSRKEKVLEQYRSDSIHNLNEMTTKLLSAEKHTKELEEVLEQTRNAGTLSEKEHSSQLSISLDRIRHLEELLDQKQRDFETQMRTLREESERIRAEGESYAQQALETQEVQTREISRLHLELESMKQRAHEASNSLHEFQVQTSKSVLDFECRVDSLNRMVDDLRTALDESENARKALEIAAAETKHQLESELIASKEEIVLVKSEMNDEISDLQLKLKQTINQNEQISRKFQEAQATIRLLEEHSGKEQSVASLKLQKVLTELKEKETFITQLQEDLLASQKTFQTERKSKETAELTHAMIQKDLKRNVEEYKKRMDQLMADHQLLSKTNSDVVKKAMYTESIALEILKEKQNLFDQVLGYCTALDLAKEDLSVLEFDFETLGRENTDLTSLLDDQLFFSETCSRQLFAVEKDHAIHSLSLLDSFQMIKRFIEEQSILQSQLDDITTETFCLRDQVSNLKETNARLISLNQEKHVELAIKAEEHENLQNRIRSLHQKMKSYGQHIEDLNDLVMKNWEHEQLMEKEKNTLADTIGNLEAEIAELKLLQKDGADRNESLERTRLENEEQLAAKIKWIQDLKQTVEQKQTMIDGLEEELQRYESTVEELRYNIAQLDAALTEASEREIEQNELISKSKSDFEFRIDELGRDLQLAKTEINRLSQNLNQSMGDMEASAKEKAILVTQLEELKIQNSNADSRIDQLNSSLREAEHAFKEAQEEQTRLQFHLSAKQDQVSELEKLLESTNISLQVLMEEKSELQIAISAKDKENIELRGSCEAANTLNEDLSTQVRSLKLSNDDLVLQIQQLKVHEQTLSGEQTALKNSIDKITSELETEKERSEKLKEMVNLTKMQISQEQEESKFKLERIQSHMEKQINDLQDENCRLESNAQFLKEQNDELKRNNEVNVSKMNQEISRLQDTVRDVSLLLEQKTNDVETALSRVETSVQQVASLEKEKEDLNSIIDHLQLTTKSEQESLKTQLKESKAYSDRLQSALDTKRQELNETLKENHRLVEEVKIIRVNSKSEFSSLKQQIADLQHYSKDEHDRYEVLVKDLKQLLSRKTSQCQILQNKLEDALSTISRAELRMANETSSRDLAIRNLKMELREKTKALESLESSLIITNQEKSLIHDQLENSVAIEVEKQIQLAAQDWDNERSTLLQKIEEFETQELERMKEMDR